MRIRPLFYVLIATHFIAACNWVNTYREPHPKEIVGKVIDAVTLQPIEGAYVIAIYDLQHVPYDYACAKALGVYSDKDGAYRFPFEKSDRYPRGYPHEVFAVKKGYYFAGGPHHVDAEANKAAGILDDRARVYLSKRDYAIAVQGFNTGHANCYQARNRQDAAASIEFLKLELDEQRTLGASAYRLDSLVTDIRALQLLPAIGGVYPPSIRIDPGPGSPAPVGGPDAAPDLLPPPDEVAKEQARIERRATYRHCDQSKCCTGFADGTRYPAAAEHIRRAAINVSFDNARKEICSSAELSQTVVRLAAEVP